MIGQHASPAYRIYNGDTILVTLWSNVAAAVDGFFRVVYDDGTTDTLRIDRVTTTSARAAFLARAAHVAKHDGYVTEGVLFADSPQRGQTYAIAYVSQGEGPGDVRMALCKGYVYASTPLAVGQQVEPGPAGGPGAVSSTQTATPSSGAEIASQQTPTGAIQRLLAVSAQLIQGVTQTPLPTLRIRTSGPVTIVQVPITPTAISASSTAQLTWAIGLVQSSFTAVVGDEFHTAPLPANLFLVAGNIWNTLTDGIGANTSYGAALFTVEEWVMPN